MSPARLSVAWQATGSAATLGAALWISWRFGLAAQGDFGLAKSWFDAAAVIASFGLPQGLLHLQYRRGVAAAALLGWLARSIGVLAAAAVLAAALLWWLGWPLPAAVAASLPFAVGHLLARSLVLPVRGVVVFGFITALPALVLLAGVLAFGAIARSNGFQGLLLAAAAIAGCTSASVAWRSAGARVDAPWPRRELWTVSLQSGLQAALGGALAAALLSTAAWSGHVADEVGAASLAWHLYQLFAVAAGYAAPLIFDRLARDEQPSLLRWPRPARLLAWALLGAAGVALLVAVAVPRLAVLALPLALVLPAGLASVAARVAGTTLLARAAYVELSLQALARLVVSIVLMALALKWLGSASALALSLLVIELCTWWRCEALARREER